MIYQATFFDGGFIGRADFVERTSDGWLVGDTKLARTVNVTALLQMAAYAYLLRGRACPRHVRPARSSGPVRSATSRSTTSCPSTASGAPGSTTCCTSTGRPTRRPGGATRVPGVRSVPICEHEVERARDVLLVAGVRAPTSGKAGDSGVATIDQLAVRTEAVADVRTATLDHLREQACLQVRQETRPRRWGPLRGRRPGALRRMPRPTPVTSSSTSRATRSTPRGGRPSGASTTSSAWSTSAPGTARSSRTFWAHDRDAERQALLDFLDVAHARRGAPDLHVYHYAPYEPTHLLRLAARHGVREDEVDQLLRDGVFVDLYPSCAGAAGRSRARYSIKKLEPLYMGAEVRASDVHQGRRLDRRYPSRPAR